MKVAALDFGSNTFLMLIADIEDGQINSVTQDCSTVVRLFENLKEDKKIINAAFERSKACLDNYQSIWKNQGCEKVVAVATSAVRDASNGDEFLKLAKSYGIAVNLISGKEEALLTYSGAFCGLKEVSSSNMAVIDIGGGSTELVCGGEGQSFNLGSVRLTEQFDLAQKVSAETLEKVRAYVRSTLNADLFKKSSPKGLVGVAGTPTTLACLENQVNYKFESIHGDVLSLNQVETWMNHLSRLSVEEREKLPGMPKGRADVLLAGTLILLTAMKCFSFSQLHVSCAGVRFGLAAQALKYGFKS